MSTKNPSLSIFFHPYVFWSLKVSGVGRYMVELGEALSLLGVELHCPIKETPTELLKNASFFSRCSEETPSVPFYLKAGLSIINQTKHRHKIPKLMRYWEGVQALKKGKYHIIHPTHNNSIEILKYKQNSRLVVTVHDMIHELFPTIFSPNDISIQRKKIMVEAADRVIAISQCTKNDLVRITGVNPDKVDVIYHGNSLCLPEDAKTRQLQIPEKYLLFVGQRNGYKNFNRFVKSAARLIHEDPHLQIVCAGGGSFSEHEQQLFKELNISNQISQSWVTDDTLAILYNRSLAFVYPSEYEGFGLPILEAFSCQVPVLCAQASCFPEVAGDACIYFNPTDEEDIYQALRQVHESENCRSKLIALGTKRLQLFSWQKCAQETLECYKKALQS